MKKIIFILSFVSIGLFANAATNKKLVGKMKKSIKKDLKNFDKKNTAQWQVTVRCGSITITSCCYPTQAAATNAGWEIYGNLHCSDMP